MIREGKHLSIGRNLIISYTLIFIFALIFGVTAWFSVYKSLNERINSELENMAQTIRDMIMVAADMSIRNHLRSITERNMDITRYFFTQVFNDEITEEFAKELLEKIMLSQTIGTTGYLFAINIRHAPGSVMTEIHPHVKGRDVGRVDFIQQAVQLKNGYFEYQWQNPNETEPRKKVMNISYFEPWRWIIGATSYIEEFNEIIQVSDFIENISSVSIGDKGYVYVLDTKGNVLIHPELRNVNILEETDAQGCKFIHEIISRKNGRINYLWKSPGSPEIFQQIAFFNHIPQLDWIVVSAACQQEIMSPIKSLSYLIIAMIITMLLIIMMILLFVNSRIIKPLATASHTAKRLGELDLTVEMKSTREDEVGRLINAMNEMVYSFRETVSRAYKSAVEVNLSAEEILRAVNEQALAASEQSASISQISSTMEEFSTTSAQIAENSNKVTGIADNTLKKLEYASQITEIVVKNINKIDEDNHNNIKEIGRLKSKIDEISKVMRIINNIADQTKLIAFNAAIESSRAGESGKRFGVVAVEIRRLADSVMESTDEIELRIDDIQTAASNMVIASETSAKGVKEAIESFSGMRSLFGEILDGGKATTDAARHISYSTSQQKTATVQVVEALKDIVRGSQQTSEAITNISSASQMLKNFAEQLKQLMEKFVVSK